MQRDPGYNAGPAGMWADQALHADAWRAGALLLAVAVVAGLLSEAAGGGEPRPETRFVGVALGALGALAAGLVPMIVNRRLPDWAIGLRRAGAPRSALAAPLVGFGWALAVVVAIGAGAIGGLGEAAAAFAVAAVAPLALAHSLRRYFERANRTRSWAAERGATWRAAWDVPRHTPLLRQGAWRYAANAIEGPLLGDAVATIAHLGVVDPAGDDTQGSHRTRRFTILVAAVADPGRRLPLCVCAPRDALPGSARVDAWAKKLRRIDLASAAFESRFELMIDREGEEVWARRLFEPTFVERLTLLDPGRIGWELEGGTLTVYRAGYVTESRELDRLVELGRSIAERIGDEVAETESLARSKPEAEPT